VLKKERKKERKGFHYLRFEKSYNNTIVVKKKKKKKKKKEAIQQ